MANNRLFYGVNMLRRKVFDNSSPANINKKLRTNDYSTLPTDGSFENNSGESSKYFVSDNNKSISKRIIDLQKLLSQNINSLNFISEQVKYVYNPLEYASEPNENFINKYCTTTKKILFVGLNPGPNGMCQTGIPFGDPKWVREWFGIMGQVNQPSNECPDRKIEGIFTKKSEPSGNRLWTFFSKVSEIPENFFRQSFLFNFCPVAFMQANGCNVTPAEFKDLKVLKELEEICYNSYYEIITILEPEIIIAIGKYAEQKSKNLFKTRNIQNISLLYMPHPSPRASGNWFKKAEDFLNNNNLRQYFQPSSN